MRIITNLSRAIAKLTASRVVSREAVKHRINHAATSILLCRRKRYDASQLNAEREITSAKESGWFLGSAFFAVDRDFARILAENRCFVLKASESLKLETRVDHFTKQN